MTHCAVGCAGLSKLLYMIAVGRGKPRRNKSFERLTDRLRLTATKHCLCRRVEDHDMLVGVGGNDGVHGRVENASHLCLTVAQSILGPFPLCDVMYDGK